MLKLNFKTTYLVEFIYLLPQVFVLFIIHHQLAEVNILASLFGMIIFLNSSVGFFISIFLSRTRSFDIPFFYYFLTFFVTTLDLVLDPTHFLDNIFIYFVVFFVNCYNKNDSELSSFLIKMSFFRYIPLGVLIISNWIISPSSLAITKSHAFLPTLNIFIFLVVLYWLCQTTPFIRCVKDTNFQSSMNLIIGSVIGLIFSRLVPLYIPDSAVYAVEILLFTIISGFFSSIFYGYLYQRVLSQGVFQKLLLGSLFFISACIYLDFENIIISILFALIIAESLIVAFTMQLMRDMLFSRMVITYVFYITSSCFLLILFFLADLGEYSFFLINILSWICTIVIFSVVTRLFRIKGILP